MSDGLKLRGPKFKRWPWISLLAALLLAVVTYTQVTIFVLQPIGAVPGGRTLVLWRRSAVLQFVDSADAVCSRTQGGVSLLCRMGALAGAVEHNPVILRLPFSRWLYLRSTGGIEFDR